MSFKITKPVRLIETFSGIGAQAMALRDLGVPFEYWKTSEWEVNAVASYKAIHFPDNNTDYVGDLSKEEMIQMLLRFGVSNDGKSPMAESTLRRKGEKWLKDVLNNFYATHNLGSILNIHAEDLEIDNNYTNILTYSYPCQSISLAGKQHGMAKGSGTRSALLWEIERILRECKELNCLPQVLLLENVTQAHGKKNLDAWNEWLATLEELGYHNYWQDLNSKNYGVAQNRDRVFMVSLLSDEPYVFPEPIELQYRLKDYLEDEVAEKYYINNEKSQKLIKDLLDRGVLPQKKVSTALLTDKGEKFDKYTDISGTLLARNYKGFGHQQMEGVIENYGSPISE